MLEYRLDDLGWEEFEHLCQALLKAKLGVGVEAWGGSGDWGNDAYCQAPLRYPGSDLQEGPFQFQVKFVQGANAAGAKPRAPLVTAVKRECQRIKKRNQPAPRVYSLLTNVVLSVELRQTVEDLIRKALPGCPVVVLHGGNDICTWLHLHGDIVRMFPPLLSHRDLAELVRQALLHNEPEARARLSDNFGTDRLVEAAHSQRVFEELARVKQRRAWDAIQAREQIRYLLDRVQSGDLRHADRAAQSAVLNWAARLHAGQPEHLEEAKRFRDRLRQLDPEADIRIPNALILETEGDGDGALRMLRDVDDSDARTALFLILDRIKGSATALEWFDDQERRKDPHFLTGLGWYRVAFALAQSDRWEEAAAYLAEAHAYLEEWPELMCLEGVVNAVFLLPLERRRHALEMNLLYPGLCTVEGPEADRHRERATICLQKAADRMAVLSPERALVAQRGLLWLRLTHPDLAVNQAAREEVRERMEDPEEALSLLQMARTFGIPFDIGGLRSVLDQRKRLGGLKEHELQAEFMLAEMSLEPADLITFLDEEEPRLRRVLPAGLLSMARIEALVKDGQAAKARGLLAEHSEEFEENDCHR